MSSNQTGHCPLWFTQVLVRNFKRHCSKDQNRGGKFETYFKSETHTSSLQRYLKFRHRQNNIDILLDKKIQEKQQQKVQLAKSNEEAIKILIARARYLARQDIAFRGHTDEESNFVQLVNLLSRHNPVLQHWLNETKNRSYT
ncbi:unnamed protein product, partial [Didymodactylos carnosus]